MEEEPPTPPTPASPFWLSSRSTRQNSILSTGLHVAALSIVAILLMAAVTPSLLSQAQQFFKPSSIKRGWDSINIVLVVFAIVCGFLGRKDDNKGNEDVEGSSKDTSGQYNWQSYGEERNVRRLRRASSSYPDFFRQEMMWDDEYDRRPRYYDDSYYVNQHKSPRLVVEDFRSQKVNGTKICKEERDGCDDDVKVIEVDHNKRMSSPPPPPPPPESVTRRVRRKKEAREDQENVIKKTEPRSAHPPAPPPPPEKKLGGTTKEIISSIYQQSKRKKKKQQNRPSNPVFPPPSPPPPPPPPSFFHNMFKKPKSGKKYPPPPPTNRRDFEFPLIPMPPPPPPPPFKVPSSKFVVQGDYVNISRSPLRDDDDDSEANTASPLFFPSPDVNMKADKFIARFRANLKIEKINSLKHHPMIASLGPESRPSPT